MADLDDFFAKKDKKKNKGVRTGAPVGKFSTADQVARRLENPEAQPPARIRLKKDKSDEPAGANEEDEWREFEEQKKDYSGLRIQNMQLNDATDNDGGGGDDDDEDEDGNRRNVPGPWKMASSAALEDSDEEEALPAPEISSAPPPSLNANAPNAYVPPHLRNSSGGPSPSSASQSGPRGGRGSRLAPDINNEAYFPTLSAASTTEPVGAWGKKNRQDEMRGFEDVRNSKSHTSRGPEGVAGGGSRSVAVENKYAALRGADQS